MKTPEVELHDIIIADTKMRAFRVLNPQGRIEEVRLRTVTSFDLAYVPEFAKQKRGRSLLNSASKLVAGLWRKMRG